VDLPQLHLSFPLLSLKQALLTLTVEKSPVFLVKFEAEAIVVFMLLQYLPPYSALVLKLPILFFLVISLSFAYSLSSVYPNSLLSHTIVL